MAILIYETTDKFPKNEIYGLASQMRRAAISIPSNIAEGYHRFHPKEKRQFLMIAFGSGAELESQVEVAKIIFPNIDFSRADVLLNEIMKILNSFLKE